MTIYYKNGEKIDEGTSLLISILVCYPEINTIKYDGESGELNLSFLLQDHLTEEEYLLFSHHCTLSLEIFCQLKEIPVWTPLLTKKSCGDCTLVEISCKISLLTKDVLSLIMEVISSYFHDDLLKEEYETPVSIQKNQEEIIASMLQDFQTNAALVHLIGLRRGGKVMVFDRS